MLIRYRSRSHKAGVRAYEIGPDFLKVRFQHSPDIYVYTRGSVGTDHLEEMQRLARLGCGLTTYISQHVHDQYERIE